jgi:hypothetical protein
LNKILAANPLTVRLPNGQTMKSTHTATLDIPQLSRVAKAAHVFPAMENNSLFSVGKLCDEGYYVLFNTNGVKILNEKQEIIMQVLNSRSPNRARAHTHRHVRAL